MIILSLQVLSYITNAGKRLEYIPKERNYTSYY
jgi:hypothetical protein